MLMRLRHSRRTKGLIWACLWGIKASPNHTQEWHVQINKDPCFHKFLDFRFPHAKFIGVL